MMPILEYEWCDDTEDSLDRVSQHTMSKVTIKVGDQNITSVYDRYLKDYRDHIFVPLSHIAEWLAVNWWHLWHEPASVSGEQHPGFSSRHDLSYAGNGFVLPRLTFTPFGNRIRLVAEPWSPKHAPLEFLSKCEAMLGRDELEQEFRALIAAVIERLRLGEASFNELESEWHSIESLDEDAREFCQAAALMGLDPFDTDAETADQVSRVWNHIDPAIREEALATAQAHSLKDIHSWIVREIEAVEGSPSSDTWSTIRNIVRRKNADGDMVPWRRGYLDADAVRLELDAPPGRFDFVQAGSHMIWSRDVEDAPSPRIQGCVASDSPSCVVVKRTEVGTRFLVGRALGDYIGREKPEPGIIGTLETPRQAQSRAFSAEFLAPAGWLRKEIGSLGCIGGKVVDDLATELGVSNEVVGHQIVNHNIAETAGPFGLDRSLRS